MTMWLITIPKTVKWSDYKKELDAVKDGTSVINYKTRYFPKEMKAEDRCYIVHDGKVRGCGSGRHGQTLALFNNNPDLARRKIRSTQW